MNSQNENLELNQLKSEHENAVLREIINKSDDNSIQIIWDSDIAWWEWDYQNQLFKFSELKAKLLGYNQEELENNFESFANLLHPDDFNDTINSIRNFSNGNSNYFEVEYRLQTKNGDWLWFFDKVRIISKDNNGLPKKIIGFSINNSFRKKADEKLNLKYSELNILYKISQSLISKISMNELIQLSINEIKEYLNPDLIIFFAYHNDSLEIMNYYSKDDGYLINESDKHLVGECLCGLGAKDKSPIYCLDILNDSRCNRDECKLSGIKSFLSLPLISGDKTLGIIGIGSYNKRDFTENSFFLETLSSQIAIGYKNSILFEKLNQKTIELEKEIEEHKKDREQIEKLNEELENRVDERTNQLQLINEQLNDEIEERKRIEVALFEQSQLNKEIIESAHEGIIVYDKNLRYLVWNPFMENITGLNSNDVIGKQPWDLFPFLEDGGVIERLNRALLGETPDTVYFPFFISKTNYQGWASDTSTPLRNANGEIIGVIANVSDITERKLAEEAIRISEEKFSKAFKNSPDIIVLSSLEDGRIVESNERMYQLSGYSKDEVIGRTIFELNIWHNINDRNTYLGILLQNGRIENFETQFNLKSGELVTGLVSGEIIDFQNKKYVLNVIRDITDIKLAQNVIADNEKKLRMAQQVGNVGHWEYDLIMNKLNWSEQMFRIYEICPDEFELNFDNVVGYFHPDDRKNVIDEYFNSVENHTDFEYTHRIITPKGNIKYITERASNNYDSEGKYLNSFGSVLDVTKLKLAELALLESEKKFKDLILNMEVGVLLHNLDAEVLLSNPTALELLGLTEEQITGKISFNLDWNIINENGEPFSIDFHPVLHAINTGKPIKGVIVGVKHSKMRDRVWLLVDAIPQFSTEGFVHQVVCTFVDISARKRAEDELLKISKAIEQSPASVVITNYEGKIEYVNPKFSEASGFSYEEAIGENPRILKSGLTPKEYYYDLWNKITNGQVWMGEFLNKNKNGELYWESSSISPIFNNNGTITHYIAVKEDITLRKQNENEIQRLITDLTIEKNIVEQNSLKIHILNEELKQLNATKDKFFSIISHDLKNPFVTLLNMSEFLINNIDKIQVTERNNILKSINESSKHTYKLLENLLHWARNQMGIIQFLPEELDLYELGFNSVYINQAQASEKNITLINMIQPDSLAICDRNMIQTVFRNLLSNAIKFTPKGGEVEIGAVTNPSEGFEPSEGYIHIYVKDSGVGLTKATIEKFFKIEENVSSIGTIGESGTGLGLILCKEFVEKHGGKIWVESEVGKGSMFWFSLRC